MRYGNTPLLAALALAGVTVGCPAPGELDLSEWPAERAVGDESSPDTGSSTASADSGAVDAAMCVPTVDYFEQEVWTPFMSITCMACHVEGGIGARSSFLDLVEVNSAADLETNLAIVRQVASRKVEGTSVLLLKPIGGDGHSGGPIISEDSADYAALAELVARFDDPPVCDPADVDAGVGDTSEPVDTATAMGDPNAHSSRNVPCLLAGGTGGAFRMGRRLRFGQECDDGRPWCNDPYLVPNNHLLVSIAQAFGVQIDSYGVDEEPDVMRGEISDLWA